MSNDTRSSFGSARGILNYGIYRLDNPCLLSQFYPDDLPEDWRLEYYNNEFGMILLTLEELEADMGWNRKTLTALGSEFKHIIDDLHENFILLVELTSEVLDSLSRDEIEQLNCLSKSLENLHFIRDTASARQIHVSDEPAFSLFLLNNLNEDEQNNCILIKDTGDFSPPALRHLLEYCFQLSDNKGEFRILFSSEDHALVNLRNAVLMDSLM